MTPNICHSVETVGFVDHHAATSAVVKWLYTIVSNPYVFMYVPICSVNIDSYNSK